MDFLRRMHLMKNNDDPFAIKMLPTYYESDSESDDLDLLQDNESDDIDVVSENIDDINEVSNEDEIQKLLEDRRLNET